MGRRHGRAFEIRRLRFLLRRSHIDPDLVAAFDAVVSGEFDFLAKAALDRFGRHLDALAGHVVFPAVIGAAQAVFLVAAEPQRYPAMGAEFVHHADTALAVTECDQPLANTSRAPAGKPPPQSRQSKPPES